MRKKLGNEELDALGNPEANEGPNFKVYVEVNLNPKDEVESAPSDDHFSQQLFPTSKHPNSITHEARTRWPHILGLLKDAESFSSLTYPSLRR